MKIKCGYSMGYAGTNSEWTEDVPDEVVAEGYEAVEKYLDNLANEIYQDACEKISVWATIE